MGTPWSAGAEGPLSPGVIEAGAAQGASRDLGRSLELERAQGGYTDMSPLAGVLLDRARRAEDPRRARLLGQLARRAAPGDPRPYRFLATLSLGADPAPGAALGAAAGFVGTLVADPWVQVAWLGRAAAVVGVACWAGALALCAAGAARYGRALLHDYADSFPWCLRRYAPPAFGLLTFSVLWAAGVGPAVLLLLLILILSPYYPPRARVALSILLLLGSLAPLALEWSARVDQGDAAWALYRVRRGDGGPGLAGDLERLFPPGDVRALFARSRLARREGRLEEAQALLTRVPGAADRGGRIALEEGNLAFLRGDLEGAVERYGAAASARPEDPLPWFNRHLAHLAALDLSAADQALARAKAIDPEAVERLQARQVGREAGLIPLSEPLPARWIRAAAWRRGGAEAGWVTFLRQGLFLPVPWVPPPVFGAFAVLVLLAASRKGAGRRSHTCPSCGFLVCPRCGRRVKGSPLCPACWAAQRGGELDEAEKERRAVRSRRWGERVGRWRRAGDLLLPGWNGFLGARPLRGAGLGALWALGVGWLALGWVYPAPVFPWGTPSFPWMAAALMAAAYGAALATALRRPAGKGA